MMWTVVEVRRRKWNTPFQNVEHTGVFIQGPSLGCFAAGHGKSCSTLLELMICARQMLDVCRCDCTFWMCYQYWCFVSFQKGASCWWEPKKWRCHLTSSTVSDLDVYCSFLYLPHWKFEFIFDLSQLVSVIFILFPSIRPSVSWYLFSLTKYSFIFLLGFIANRHSTGLENKGLVELISKWTQRVFNMVKWHSAKLQVKDTFPDDVSMLHDSQSTNKELCHEIFSVFGNVVHPLASFCHQMANSETRKCEYLFVNSSCITWQNIWNVILNYFLILFR